MRARMVAISEVPELWRRSLGRWRTLNRRWKRRIDEADAPDANEEYLLYQTLLGTWPLEPFADLNDKARGGIRRAHSAIHGQGAERGQAEHELDPA